MSVKTKFRFLFIVFILAALIFTTCDSPMGMGKPIDWIPPVLTLDPEPPTPMYVGLGTTLSGTVTDNEKVERVILRDSVTGEELFTAELLADAKWQIVLAFSPEQNGETVLADVVAFDRAGNSGAESIASVVLIIDIRPPLVEDIWVQRTSVRTSDLYKYNDIKQFEKTDPNAELSKNVDVFQNGAFYIKAKISEEDTFLESVTLKIFDSRYPDTELLSLAPDSGFSFYAPQWYLTEDMILNAGASLLPEGNYKANYKDPVNSRYYYRLRVVAVDKGKNEGQTHVIIEDKDYFCLWNQADFPKGILDTRVVGAGTDITVTKGSQLPVEFFDDDKIDWAYAGLFTIEQWNGTGGKQIASGVTLSGDDNAKFELIKNRLLASPSQPVYNWKYDRKSANPTNATSEPLVNLVPPDGADEKTEFIVTGNDDTDYGDYVFVSFVKDKKLAPHANGEYPDLIKYRKYNVTLVDENAPLIVFDKTTTSPVVPGVATPEENTFPTLDASGKFTIHGYTLREDKTLTGTPGGPATGGTNKVQKFRMAWVPFDVASANTEPSPETKVKVALKAGTGFPEGVQWWDMDTDIQNSNYYDKIGDGAFRRQYFKKTFSILGAEDDKKSAYDNFRKTKGGTLENATKLFIFYAEDNMGHDVYRQFYLLGNTTPPTISVYDLTDRIDFTPNPGVTSPPDILLSVPTGNISLPGGDAYLNLLNTWLQTYGYGQLKTVANNLSVKTDNYKMYPRRTTVKLWADATANGALGIDSIKMEDITYKDYRRVIGYYNTTDRTLGYAETFPDVTQRVFLFTAKDQLGNEASVQRTIAVASAATLTSITTATQNGTYPAGEIIELKANFDGMIRLQNHANGQRPRLNVLYQIGTSYAVQQIQCEDEAGDVLSLTFKFTVPENALGTLQTIYDGISNIPTFSANNSVISAIPNTTNYFTSEDIYNEAIKRPIYIVNESTSNILDTNRGDKAFTPGNITGFNWTTAANSLQYVAVINPNGKTIGLDGVIPTITKIEMVNTKNPFTPNNWYLKSGESISFNLTASKPLKVSGTSALGYRLQRPNNAGLTTYDNTNFEYRKITGNIITFTLDVSRTTIPNDGTLQNTTANPINLVNPGNISDLVGNKINITAFTTLLNAELSGKTINFDLTAPPKPVTGLTPTTGDAIGTNPNTTKLYNTTPTLTITNPNTTTEEPYGIDKRQYSLDGGLFWVDFPTAYYDTTRPWTTVVSENYNALYINNGQWSLKTRFIDRAGNEGATTDQLINVNNAFPKLVSVSVVQPNATYVGGNTLDFKLEFDDLVTVPATGVTMTLADLTSTTQTPGGLTPSYSYAVTATQSANSRTVTFTWKLTNNTYDMLNGLRITGLSIDGITDKFGNTGPTSGITFSNTSLTISGNSANYNFQGVIVSTISPTIRSREPQHAGGRTGNITNFTAAPDNPPTTPNTAVVLGSVSVDGKTIKLNFNKPMSKGNGTIIIRPHGNYAVPAVFTNDEFYTVFNNGNDTDKTNLVGSTSMSAPALVQETGLSAGPYLKTTHGLVQGAGFTGNYTNNGNYYAAGGAQPSMPATNNGYDAPGARGTDRMVPDLSLKWVLRYNINNIFDATDNSTVSKIRIALDNAKFRWQEIPVSSSAVAASGNSITITLPTALPDGLQWDVYYPEGTFTDTSGNKVATMARGDYWFWTKGVQKPVIRVNRKSYDARPTGNYSGDIVGKAGYNNTNAYSGDIDSFNTVAYVITSETPQARVFFATQTGADGTGSVTAAWTGNVTGSTTPWNGPKPAATNQTRGSWVRPNLMFRHGRELTYDYLKEPNITISRTLGGSEDGQFIDNNRYYGFRSYNKDATFTELNTTLTITPTSGKAYVTSEPGSFTYSALQASKNYVAAIASIDHKTTASDGTNTYNSANYSSDRGFEGVFRTVIAMNQAGITGSDGANPIANNSLPMLIAGTDARSGLPTVPGFPLKDGVHRNDARFVKLFYRDSNHFTWVTTEMVTQWYLQLVGRGNGSGSYSKQGDVEDWVSAGYGDLSYAFNLATW